MGCGTFRRSCVLAFALASLPLAWAAPLAAQSADSNPAGKPRNEAKAGARSDAKPDAQPDAQPASPRDRWSPAQNRTWRWFERETLAGDKWRLTGITTPIHRETGERFTGAKGYLSDADVPADVRRRGHADVDLAVHLENDPAESNEPGKIDPIRKAREGRPASKWVRSLNAEELRKWLPTIDPPEAGVEGMTFFEHLTRDHGFDPAKIEGLSEDEQAKLHAAAHEGY